MVNEDDISLGYRVEDRISGFVGIVTDVGYHLTGCTRFGVMPDSTEDPSRRGDTEFFYADQLEIVAENTSFAETGEDAVTDVDFELGTKVRDQVTGFEGVASVITFNLFNCPRVSVRPVPDGGLMTNDSVSSDDISSEWFDAPRLERTGNGVQDDFEALIEEGTTAETGAGQDVERKTDKR